MGNQKTGNGLFFRGTDQDPLFRMIFIGMNIFHWENWFGDHKGL